MPTTFTDVQISEFLPDPKGDDTHGEWIELQSTAEAPVSLCGWSIDDGPGGSHPYPLNSVHIVPGKHEVFTRDVTSIALNNDADQVRLIAPLQEGGTGVFLSVGFGHAQEGQSYALRQDFQWLWTRFLTPGTPNEFIEAPESIFPPRAVILRAMPNPKGLDTGNEWVELKNKINGPLYLRGWKLENDSDSCELGALVLPRIEPLRINSKFCSITLTNTEGSLRLVDPNGQIESVLAWRNAKDGVREEAFQPRSEPVEVFAKELRSDGTLEVFIPYYPVREFEPTVFEKRNIQIPGVHFLESKNILYLHTVLINKKKIELYFDSSYDSQSASGAFVFLDGVDIGRLILERGDAFTAFPSGSLFLPEYDYYEQWAKDHLIGLWSDIHNVEAVSKQKEQDTFRRILEEEGMNITVSPSDSIVTSGSTVSIETNVPSDVYVSENGNEFQPYLKPKIVNTFLNLRVKAIPRVGSGVFATSTVIQRQFLPRELFSSGTLSITEIYPSPKPGEPEWIEVSNNSNFPIPLDPFFLDDTENAGSKQVRLSQKRSVPPKSSMVIGGVKIAWNNSGDDVRLLSASGEVIASASYPTIKKGLSYARDANGNWCLTSRATPGSVNVCETPKVSVKKKSAKKPKKKKTKYEFLLPAHENSTLTGSNVFSRLRASVSGNESDVNESAGLSHFLVIAFGFILLLSGAIFLQSVMRRKQE